MVAVANEEDNKRAAITFQWALAVERIHAELYFEAIENLDSKEVYEYTICPICGYTHKGPAPENTRFAVRMDPNSKPSVGSTTKAREIIPGFLFICKSNTLLTPFLQDDDSLIQMI